MINKTKYFLIFLFSFCILSGVNAQTVGKLFTKAEANKLYGPVQKSITISSSELANLASRTTDKLLVNIVNGQLYIMNNRRTALKSGPSMLSANQVFHVYSASLVKELIDKGGQAETTIEQRGTVISLTNGNVTLEFSTDCPPYCP